MTAPTLPADASTTLSFRIERSANPVAADVRAQAIAAPVFGRVFTDHMAVVNYTVDRGWHDPRIVARAPIPMDPASSVLHYAQEIFEGLKAYKRDDGSLALFRADANARRFQASAERLAMPALPVDLFLDSVRALVRTDADWFPTVEGGALYLRPFMFASEVFLGVRPAQEYQYIVIASPVGNYFKAGPGGADRGVSLWVSQDYSRAAAGGTGAAKCGGNYAASLAAQSEAIAKGHDQVVFLDAVERRWIEELGGMNIFFVFADGSIQTPPLTGTILPGITRDAILTLAREEGLTVREQPYDIDSWRRDAESGALVESFACGTAAVVTPVGSVHAPDFSFTVGSGSAGQTTKRLKNRLVAIQRGQEPDAHGWVQPI